VSDTTLGWTTPRHSEGVSGSNRARRDARPPYFAGVRGPVHPPPLASAPPWRYTTPVTPPRRGAESPCAAYERVPARNRVTTGRVRETGTLHMVTAAASVVGGGGAAAQCRTRALARVLAPRVTEGSTVSVYSPVQAAVPRRAAHGAHGAASDGAKSDRRWRGGGGSACHDSRSQRVRCRLVRTPFVNGMVDSLGLRSIDICLVIKKL